MNKYTKEIITYFEGCKLKSYQDSVNVWTIGYGHTVGVAKGLHITQEQADTWLEEDISSYEKTVLEETEGLELEEWQIASLTSFTYNLGKANFKDSTLLKVIKLDKDNYDDIAVEFIKWDNAGGSEIKGLSKRRIAESCLYANGRF